MEAQEIHKIPFPLHHLRETANGTAEPGSEPQPFFSDSLLPDSQTLTKIQLLERQAAQPCERVGILVELAAYRLEAGRTEQAIELLERAIRCHSQAVQPVLLLGKAWEAEGEYDKALEIYLEALQRGVASAEVEAVLFRQEFLLNTYPRSVAELAFVAVRKKDGLLWRLLARACETNADYEQALSFLTEALQEDPKDVATLSMLARIAEKQKKMDEAVMWHRRILEINPDLPVSNRFLAQWHYAQGEYAAALPYFARLRFKERNNRLYQLSWLLAHVHVSGVDGLEEQLEGIRTWQNLTTEEQALAQELFLVASERSLEEGRARAEQYILQALHLAPSSNGSSLLAAVEAGKTERALYKKVLETLANEEQPQNGSGPAAALVPPTENVFSSPKKDWSAQPAWIRRVLQRVSSRIGEVSPSEEKDN
jgi:tetratricopeptide (TPR) repeat protein